MRKDKIKRNKKRKQTIAIKKEAFDQAEKPRRKRGKEKFIEKDS